MPFQIIRNDIVQVRADAIVNTANPEVAIGDGVDSAIYKAAGRDRLIEARRKIGVLMPGEVGITEAFDLDARYIIHASGPWWEDGTKGEADCLRSCYEKSLRLAKEYGCRSIAFPLLAVGTYGFPKELGIRIAVDAFTDFLKDNDMEITLVVFESDAVSLSGKLVDDVASFIDDRYVEDALAAEYGMADWIRPDSMKFTQPKKKADSLEDALKEIYTDSFEKHLQQLINKKGLRNSEVYAAANISKQYFSKLLKGLVKPSKEKMLALAVGLRLNLDETADFLRIAGYAISPISQTDRIVEYFIEHEDYNVLKIDIVLFDYGLDPLSS